MRPVTVHPVTVHPLTVNPLIARRLVRGASHALVLASLLLTACAFDKITLPAGESRVVVHGVLNPGVPDQVVLVERSLTGVALDRRTAYDSLDPIASDGGSPERNARVIVYGPRGDSVVLREDAAIRADKRGAGVYRFLNLPGVAAATDVVSRLVIVPGEQYRLRVTTASGESVTGETLVPFAPGLIGSSIPRQFDRDRDSLFLGWPDVTRSARYELRVESPSGPLLAFVDSLEYLVAGSLVLPNAAGRPRVFWPGFRQVITVSAVDANYHDYYRSGSDPISNRGLLVHLTGGLGMFGSVARVRERTVDVIAAPSDAPAGTWEAVSGATGAVPSLFRLWRESAAVGVTRLTGTRLDQSISAEPQAIVAVQTGTAISVTILARQSLRDTLVTLDGRMAVNNTDVRFTGTVRGGSAAPVVFRITP